MNLTSRGFFCYRGPSNENKGKKKDRQIFGSFLKAANDVKHEVDSDANCSWFTWNYSKRYGKETRGTRDQRNNRDY